MAALLQHSLQTRRRRRLLRSGLLTEIRSTEWLGEEDLCDLLEVLNERGVSHSYFPTSVYDGCVDQLGLLEQDEREEVIDYYSYAHIASEQLSDIYRDEGDVTTFVEGTLDTLIERRYTVIETLEDNL